MPPLPFGLGTHKSLVFSANACRSWCAGSSVQARVSHNNAWTALQYIPRNMHTVFALLCFVAAIHWLIFPYPPGLLHWHCGNLTIALVPANQLWWIWINTSCEFIMNDCITTTKQSTTKPCAYFLGYTVNVVPPKEPHWPLCTGWRLGWCRTLPMPVSIRSCGCCPVAVVCYPMLCHTQCIKSVSMSSPHFKWVTTHIRLAALLHCICYRSRYTWLCIHF